MTRLYLGASSLYAKVAFFLGLVLLTGATAVGIALWSKDHLAVRFEHITSLEEDEHVHLLALWTATDLTRDLVAPSDGIVFVRVSEWMGRLSELNSLQKALALPQPDGREPVSFAVFLKRLRDMLHADPTTGELQRFSRELSEKLNGFSEQLHTSLTELREHRATLIADYRRDTDFYASLLLGAGLAAFTLVVVLAGVFVVRLVRALRLLRERAGQITNGVYGKPLRIKRDDEIGQLVESVNAMACALERNEKSAEEFRRRLFQQEKMYTIGSFAAGMAHEVGNPIQAIVALTSQVAESLAEDPSPENVRENVDRVELIAGQAERLHNTVNDMREFAHCGSTPIKEPVDIHGVIHATLRLLRFDSRFKRIDVELNLDSKVPPVIAVSDHLVQVLLNLLINAADAVADRDGRITLTTVHDNGAVVLWVSDNGTGIEAAALSQATEPFFTTKERGKGTGLGLAVCRSIVEEHDGVLAIESTPGLGTSVSVRLPAAEYLVSDNDDNDDNDNDALVELSA